MNFTRTPNAILDKLPDMKKNELKLTMLLVRLTFGYMENGRHREEVRLTFKDMMDEMQVAKATVNKAVQAVEKRGFFRRGRRSTWHLNPFFSLNMVQKVNQNGSESEPNTANAGEETVQKVNQNGSESEPKRVDNGSKSEPFQLNKEREREEKENPPSPFPFRPSPKNDLPEHKSPADKRLDAILAVCEMDRDVPKHLTWCEHAAAQLRNYSADWILGRYGRELSGEGWHWYTDDWRGQKGNAPTPAQVVETISLQKTAVPPAVSGDGRSQPASASERIRAQIAAQQAAQTENAEHV